MIKTKCTTVSKKFVNNYQEKRVDVEIYVTKG